MIQVERTPYFVKRLIGAYATREEYGIPTIKKREEVERLFQQSDNESILLIKT
jgi:hypothetical protein